MASRIGENGLIARHHVQQVQQLAFVFVDALDLHIEQAGRVQHHAQLAPHPVRQRLLVGMLDGKKSLLRIGIAGQCTQRGQLTQIASPSRADPRVEKIRQRRIGLRQPATRCHAIGDVVEARGQQFGEVGKDGLHHQLRMQFGDAIYSMRGDDRQRRHAYPATVLLVDQRHARDQFGITRHSSASPGTRSRTLSSQC